MKSYIKCVNVDYESVTEEAFNGLLDLVRIPFNPDGLAQISN